MKYLIIDGSNLVREIYGFNNREARKEKYQSDTANSAIFISVLKRFLKRCPKFKALWTSANSFIEVYFDGKPRDIASSLGGAMACICSGYSSSDEKILERIECMPGSDRRKVLLLTFDRNLAAQARGLSAHAINPHKVIEKIRQFGLDLYMYA